jgi:hypothetical protein
LSTQVAYIRAPRHRPARPTIEAEMNRAIAVPVLVLLAGASFGVRAAATGSAPAGITAAPASPEIVLVPDGTGAPAAAAAPARSGTAATPVPAADRRDTGIPHALPAYALPERTTDACGSQAVPHPVGFTQMGGSGTDTITDHGRTTTYTVYERHAPLQFVCTQATAGGGVEVDAVLQAVAPDADTYVFDISPAGLTVASITAGREAQGAEPLAVGRRIAAWPTGGCGTVTAPGIDDTFCFARDGSLRHVDLHERQTFGAVSRDLSASLDAFPAG